MVREYSADGLQPPQEASDGLMPRSDTGGAANLTQELAQLLAASIAQNQPGKRPGGTPTGSELASLAALVSSQRAAVPSFKDGLSSLSYAPSSYAPSPVSTAPVPQSGGSVLIERHDDEPMPIPSTWRQPSPSDDERWYRQQLGAAALGLAAGLVIVIPSVLWLSGFFGGPQTRQPSTSRAVAADVAPVKVAESRPRDVAMADIRPVKVQVVPVEKTENATQFVAAKIDTPPPVEVMAPPVIEQAPVPVPAPVARAALEPPRPRAEDLLKQAERRIGNGDIMGAREFLIANEGVAPGPILFALAETYDPMMLAAWGTRGISADVVKARALYAKARDLGDMRAQARLDQLR
jgi:hypothetical protein